MTSYLHLSALAMILVAFSPGAAPAQSFQLLYTFTCGGDGAVPYATPLVHHGFLYGTTWQGGTTGLGVVYRIDIKTRQETALHTFQGGPSDGSHSDAGLVRDSAGDLYGVTDAGGAYEQGAVFELQPSGQARWSSLMKVKNGSGPQSTLVRDAQGNLYGNAYFSGPKENGTIFKVDTAGNIHTLFAFDINDGGGPKYGPMILKDGTLYGATLYGGAYSGVIYKFDLSTGAETILYNFTESANSPAGGLAMDSAGNLYGTTSVELCVPPQCGSVFKLNASGDYTTLHSFTGGADGWGPLGSVILDSQGNLYGTTNNGGYFERGTCQYGCGTVFKIDTTGAFTTLYSFKGGADGDGMYSGVALGADGILYGASEAGGAFGCGTVFAIQP
jgi:uncharacterized repeat protein (TIGR03803 family)